MITLKEAIQNPEQQKSQELIRKFSQANKRKMIKEDLETIKKLKGVSNLDYNTLTDYCVEEYKDIFFIGRKEEPVGLYEEEQEQWFFRGFCTYQEFKEDFSEAYDQFKEEYGDYNFYADDECDLYLEVSGAILGEEILIDYKTKEYWKEKRVLVTALGIDGEGKIKDEQEVAHQVYEQFKKDVEEIKEQGGPNNYEEAKKLQISKDTERIWLGEYRQFY